MGLFHVAGWIDEKKKRHEEEQRKKRKEATSKGLRKPSDDGQAPQQGSAGPQNQHHRRPPSSREHLSHPTLFCRSSITLLVPSLRVSKHRVGTWCGALSQYACTSRGNSRGTGHVLCKVECMGSPSIQCSRAIVGLPALMHRQVSRISAVLKPVHAGTTCTCVVSWSSTGS